jgi:hypothetical protein
MIRQKQREFKAAYEAVHRGKPGDCSDFSLVVIFEPSRR